MRRLLDTVAARWQALSRRERILVGVMAGCGVALAVVVCVVMVWNRLSGLESSIEANDEVLLDLTTRGDQLLAAQQEKDKEEARFDREPPALPGLLERLAGESGIEIPESRELPDDAIGKKWLRKAVEVRLRRVGLKSVTDFMVKIENENRSIPLAITHLSIKRRAGEPDSYDVDLTVSTYSKVTSGKNGSKTKKKKDKAGKSDKQPEPVNDGEQGGPVTYGPEA